MACSLQAIDTVGIEPTLTYLGYLRNIVGMSLVHIT